MFSRQMQLMFIAGGLLLATTHSAFAEGSGGPRQYYTGWTKSATANYYYRDYYYKPSADYSGYKHHFVIFYPDRPKYVYFYNPYKKLFWGRCDAQPTGQGLYSLLVERDRRGSVAEIPEAAFPPPAPVPTIPESQDKIPLDLPPDDAPNSPGLPPM